MESTSERKTPLKQWLSSACGLDIISMQALPGDASLRRYFRVMTPQTSYIVMDAPPPVENCHPFIAIAKALQAMGLKTPEIFAADVDLGFLLLTDLGDTTFLKALNAQNAHPLYSRALSALAILQNCRSVPNRTIPPFTPDFMFKEWAWHKEWFLEKWLQLDQPKNILELDRCYADIVESAAMQPQVFMHRDYHSANLMVLPESVGILDFQDAFIGPVTYDLASLLRDCYVSWPEEKVTEWALTYHSELIKQGVIEVNASKFLRWFDLMGMQRHLKCLLTYARKAVRDQQPNYLQHVPRAMNYLQSVSARYPELSALHQYLTNIVQPAVSRGMLLCAQ